MVAIRTQQVFAPRECPGCAEFKKLTNEFEKAVLNAAVDDPNSIQGLVDEYSRKVLELFPRQHHHSQFHYIKTLVGGSG